MTTFLGMPGPPASASSELSGTEAFPVAARAALGDSRLRRNLSKATGTIRAKRASVVDEVADWQELREAGRAIKEAALARLPELLVELEGQVEARGGVVHWARDAEEANEIVLDLVRAKGAEEVVKVKSMTTQEINLNAALEAAGIRAIETDLAELIVQLGRDKPSHILVPAIHRGRAEIRQIFLDTMPGLDPDTLSDEPRQLAEAARVFLRAAFLRAGVAISGANFAVAQTGSLAVVESEGNGRMCLTLPETLITVMGIEKVIPTWRDLEVFLQLLPRSSTGERMNPYTSTWSGVRPGDGPSEFHLVLLDNGRTRVLADPEGRSALHCIRCSACLNVCPVYERAGGHAYGSVYPGPIGAILSPQLTGLTGDSVNDSLPYASSLCGACEEVCPVKIPIPAQLVRLRAEHVEAYASAHRIPSGEAAAMRTMSWMMSDTRRFSRAGRAARLGRKGIRSGRSIVPLPPPLSGWVSSRDLPDPPEETFREWWARTRGGESP